MCMFEITYVKMVQLTRSPSADIANGTSPTEEASGVMHAHSPIPVSTAGSGPADDDALNQHSGTACDVQFGIANFTRAPPVTEPRSGDKDVTRHIDNVKLDEFTNWRAAASDGDNGQRLGSSTAGGSPNIVSHGAKQQNSPSEASHD